jgi:hypothetical protein
VKGHFGGFLLLVARAGRRVTPCRPKPSPGYPLRSPSKGHRFLGIFSFTFLVNLLTPNKHTHAHIPPRPPGEETKDELCPTRIFVFFAFPMRSHQVLIRFLKFPSCSLMKFSIAPQIFLIWITQSSTLM